MIVNTDISQCDEDSIDMLETSIHPEVWIENLPKLDKLCLDIYIEITYILSNCISKIQYIIHRNI